MNKIFNQDCFDVFDKLKEKSIDLVVVDVPFGITNCEWDTKIDINRMWIDLKRICTKKCIYAFFCTTKFGVDLINSNPRWFKYDLIFEKSLAVGFLNANRCPLRKHEMIYIFANPAGREKVYNPQKTKGKPYTATRKSAEIYGDIVNLETVNTGDRFPTSILKFPHDKLKMHQTQKPVKLYEWLIKTYSNKDDTVLDFCAGSMTCAIACMNVNRNYICIEKDKNIFEKGKSRIDEKITASR